MKYLSLIIALLWASEISAQHIITGTITDENAQPLPWCNILLYPLGDLTPVASGYSAEDGTYQLTEIPEGLYRLQVSYIGYVDNTIDSILVSDGPHTITQSIQLEPDQNLALSEVVVTSRRPKIIQTPEKLIVDIENSALVTSNVMDIVKKVPGLTVVNGTVRYLGGLSGITIFINGKPTTYMDIESLLRDMPADNISRVELIQQPGAEFDADGTGPILNILLKRNVSLGTKGNIKASAGYDNEPEYGLSGFVSHFENNLNLQLGVGVNQVAWRSDLGITRTVGQDIYDQLTSTPHLRNNNWIDLGVDYYVEQSHTIGIRASRNENRSDYTENIRTTIIGGEQQRADLFTNNFVDNSWELYVLNPYYEFQSLDQKHKITADYSFVDRSSMDNNALIQVRESPINYDNQRNDQTGEYQVHTYKLDYTFTPVDQLTLQTGLKIDAVDLDNDLIAQVSNQDGQYENALGRSNHFLIEEDILALYGKASYILNNWSFSAGLRWEESRTTGTSITLDSAQTRHIAEFFPSLSLQRKLTDQLAANVAYSYRIDRPAYSTLNPFVFYYDPFTFDEGNPRLKPGFTQSYRFNLSYENQPFFNVEFNQTKDAMFQFIDQNDQTAEASRRQINLENQDVFSTYIGAPLDPLWKKLSGHIAFGVNYMRNRTTDNVSVPFDQSNWSWFVDIGAEFSLPWEWRAEIYGGYTNGGLDGMLQIDHAQWSGLSISKQFLDDRLRVTAGVHKILSPRVPLSIDHANVNFDIISDESRAATNIELTYYFGNKFKNTKDRNKAAQDVLDRID